MNLVEKIIHSHLTQGVMELGSEIVVKVDQTLSHDLSSVVIGQIFDAVQADGIKIEKSVFYCDHNVLCTASENSDDHYFLKTCAERFGLYFSKPGNGICHTIHCERFAAPGKIIIGGDSHTPTSGAVGALAIGTGGLTVAKAALGEGFRFRMPKIIGVRLTGKLRTGVGAKDVALELLRRISVKGGLGSILEYHGDGVKNLSMTERMTIANMSIETGATSGVFVSDEVTKAFLNAQQRGEEFQPMQPDADAVYDSLIEIDMSQLIPLTACPHSPDNVVPVEMMSEVKPASVFIGSCTNSSYADIARAAAIMKGRKVHRDVDCVVAPGSHPVMQKLLEDGVLDILVQAGCRVLECACGPCIGVGQIPRSNGISVRTSNRNFPGRCGSMDAGVYLVSPETAAATAVAGHLMPALELVEPECLEAVSNEPITIINDTLLIPPLPVEERLAVKPVYGPNISELPRRGAAYERIQAGVGLRLGDNITTDDIIPGGSSILKFISNIPAFAEYSFCYVDPNYVKRAKAMGHSIIVGGENYGQGSSREHAAILPMFLGVDAVIAKSFARIHKENLINFGILPLQFPDNETYQIPQQGDELVIENVPESIRSGRFTVQIPARGISFEAILDVSEGDKELLLAGGALNLLAGTN